MQGQTFSPGLAPQLTAETSGRIKTAKVPRICTSQSEGVLQTRPRFHDSLRGLQVGDWPDGNTRVKKQGLGLDEGEQNLEESRSSTNGRGVVGEE